MITNNVHRIIVCSCLLLLLLGSAYINLSHALPIQQAGLGNPVIHEISENVYAVTGMYHYAGEDAGTNAGIIFTDKSIVFIDAGFTIASAEFLWNLAEKRMMGNEKLVLILTHHHGDHTFGMRVMKERGATVLAHRSINEWLKDDNGRYKQFIIRKTNVGTQKGDEIYGDVLLSEPDQLIEQDTVITIDGEAIHLLFTSGHTVDEIVVYHPKSKTLFAGDAIYEGSRPTMRFGERDDWKIWITHLQRMKKLDIETIVPGHGKVCGKEEIDRNIGCLEEALKNSE